jgi:tetratricopeptide (TPR) repeat protein
VFVLAVSGYLIWRRLPVPSPPAVVLDDADLEVVEVIEAARTAVRNYPRSGAAWGKLGMVLFAHGCAAEATECFAHAERCDPENGRWPYYRATIVLLDHPEEGLKHLRRAVERARFEFTPRLVLAEVLLENGQTAEADRLFRQVLDEEPREPRAHLGAAQIAFRQGNWKTARTHLDQARIAAPGAKAIRALLAELHFRLGDQKAAEAELQAMASLPDNQGWPDSWLAEMERLKTGLKTRLARAEALIRQKRHLEAMEGISALMQRYPDSPKVHEVMAQALLLGGKTTEGEKMLHEAIRLGAEAIEPRIVLGQLLMQQGNHTEAETWFRQVIDRQPHHAQAHHQLGCCRREQNDLASAIQSLRMAVSYKPDLADAHRDLAELLARQGRHQDAVQSCRDALRLNPSDEKAKELLARVDKLAGKR